MGLLNFITQGCDQLSATAAPSITSLGLRMCIALATIMLVWFGVQEALASSQGGPGFSMSRFISFFVLITFAYTLVKYYDSAISRSGIFAQRVHQRRSPEPCVTDRHRQYGCDDERAIARPAERRPGDGCQLHSAPIF